MLVLTDTSVAGQKALGAVNLGVLDTKAPEIGYGTVYVDDYSVERPILVVQTKTETSVTTTTIEVVPAHIYWSLPIVAIGAAGVTYGILSLRKRTKPQRAANSTGVSRMLCVKCGMGLHRRKIL